MTQITIPSGSNYSQWYDKPFYTDKTFQIVKIKNSLVKETAIFFSRPRRWGKSLFLSTIKHFFDERYFKEEYFIDKDIWQDEELRKKAGTYLSISLDLKPIYDSETKKLKLDDLYEKIIDQLPAEDVKKLFEMEKPNSSIGLKKMAKELKEYYPKIGIFVKDTIEYLSKTKNLLLLIDEYDKPVNDCLKNYKDEKNAQKILDDLKNDFYSYLKDIPCITFVTGVNKLSMAGFFSDFNNLKDYSNFTCLGFDKTEVIGLFQKMGIEYKSEIKKWYNGYFYGERDEFNPWSICSYLENKTLEPIWSKTGTSPDYFTHLINKVFQVDNFKDFLDIATQYKYTKSPVRLDFIAEKDKKVILHYFYYAGLLSVDYNNNFFVPNNDVLTAYEGFLLKSEEIPFQVELKTILVDALENIDKDLNYLAKFIKFLLISKYICLDKKEIAEMIIVSDVALLIKSFSHLDLRREVNTFPGRTDLEFIDHVGVKCLFEFKVCRKSSEVEKKKREAREQLKRYNEGGKYGRLISIVVDLEGIEVLVDSL